MRTRTIRRLLASALLAAFSAAAAAEDCEAGIDCPGLSLGGSYTGDWRRNTAGGLQSGAAYSHLFTLGADWRVDSLFEEAQLSGSASVMYIGGDGISARYVGDLQGINNIEADTGWYLYEVWTEFGFGADAHTTLRAGVLDLNAEFDVPQTSGLFAASPFGVGTDLSQTGAAGPSIWPVTGLGIRAAGARDNGLAWRFGVYDGAPGNGGLHVSSDEGVIAIGELEYHSQRVNKMVLGAWGYSAAFERLDAAVVPDAASPSRGNRGWYALADLPLGRVGDARLDGALRLGTASGQFNPVERYVGAAFTASDFWSNRPQDQLGLGVAWANLGKPYRDAQAFAGTPAAAAEICWELTYVTHATPWLVLKPALQLVQHPGADAALADAWVVGLRFEVSQGESWRLSARRVVPDGDSVARNGQP